MAIPVFDGKFRVYVGAVAPVDPQFPTLVEVQGMTDVTHLIPKDGVSFNVSNNRVSLGSLVTTYDAETMGTWSAQPSITFMRDATEADDDAWSLFSSHGNLVSVVISPFGEAESGSRVYSFPNLRTGAPMVANTATNERQTFSVDFAGEDEPYFDAVIDGGS